MGYELPNFLLSLKTKLTSHFTKMLRFMKYTLWWHEEKSTFLNQGNFYLNFIIFIVFFHYLLVPLCPPPSIITLSMSMSPFPFCSNPPSPNIHPYLAVILLSMNLSLETIYFACLFNLFIRFHIWVKSYSICLSLTGLFHLA